MDVEDWHKARAAQAAYREGQEAAARDYEKAKEREQKEQASLSRLKDRVG